MLEQLLRDIAEDNLAGEFLTSALKLNQAIATAEVSENFLVPGQGVIQDFCRGWDTGSLAMPASAECHRRRDDEAATLPRCPLMTELRWLFPPIAPVVS